MITVGCIVKLDGSKYKVHEVATNRGVTYPYRVSIIDRHGEVSDTILTDKYDAWARHKWVVIGQGEPVDPKAKIIAKIKYLDEKFKKNQERKAQLKAATPIAESTQTNYDTVRNLDAETLRTYMDSLRVSIRSTSISPPTTLTSSSWDDLVWTTYER